MFERFTDRARKVMALANQEATRYSHEFIGTEHMLLGLVKEGSGVAANVLKNLNMDLVKVRQEVEKLVKQGPEIVVASKLPQTPRAKKAIEYAIEEARNLNHNYVGTEHLLLGLLRENEGVAAQVLMNLGLKLEEVREEVLNLLGAGTDPENQRDLPSITMAAGNANADAIKAQIERLRHDKDEAVKAAKYEEAAKLRDQIEKLERVAAGATPVAAWAVPILCPMGDIFHLAGEEARLAGSDVIRAEHLLLALMREPSGRAAAILRGKMVTLEALRTAARNLPGK